MATTTRVWVVNKPANVSPCHLQKLRTEENLKCRQVLESSPPLCLPPGDFVLFIKKAAKNLEGQFLSTIDDANQEFSGDLEQLAGVSKPVIDDQIFAGPELMISPPQSSVSQVKSGESSELKSGESSEVPRKQRKLEESPKTLLIFELKKQMEEINSRVAMLESDKQSFQGRVATLESENGVLKKRMGMYHSTGVSLVAAACSLVEYAADHISFHQRILIASTLLQELSPDAKLKESSQLLQDVNSMFRRFWRGFGYVEDVRFNAYIKRVSKPGVEDCEQEDTIAIGALEAFASELDSTTEKLGALMEWYINSYRLIRNREIHVFGIFKDPAYEEELKEEEEEEEKEPGQKRKKRKSRVKRGKFNPTSIEELEQRLEASCGKPGFRNYTKEEVEMKLEIHQNFVEYIGELPAPFRPHLDVFKKLASHAHSELVKLRDLTQ